ncbi:tobamovirus multiplication protein 2A [Trifolium repens]|nr:tobamovirus multiplication protein 2A [Trifolium repens]
MAKRPFFEFILQVINLVFTLFGLGILGYGLICFFKWRQTLPKEIHHHILQAVVDPPQQSPDTLPKPWFIYVIIGLGAILLIVSCLGSVGIATTSPCCLLTVIPKDINEDYYTIYNFVNLHWKVIRWIALGVFILQIIAFTLAIYLRSVFNSAWYDTDDEERIVHLPHPRKLHYNRLVAPTRTTTLTRTTGVSVRVNGRDPKTTPTNPSNANASARSPTNSNKQVLV